MARYQNYTTLVFAEAVANALVIVFAALSMFNGSASALVPPQLLIGMSLVALGYFAAIHPFVKTKSEYLSALILSILSLGNIILLMAGSGGLDSPYYALWLGCIVVASAFGLWCTISITALSLLAFGLSWSAGNYKPEYLRGRAPQIITTIAVAVIVEVVYWQNSKRKLKTTDSTKQLETKLSQENFKAQTLINAMAEGVLVIDSASHITLINPAAEFVTGWTSHSAVGLDYHSVTKLSLVGKGKDTTAQPTDPVAQALTDGKPVASNDTELTIKSGAQIKVAVTATSLPGEDAKSGGVLLVIRDITKQKELERQKDEFVSTASHEMRTPVAAIEGYLSLAMNPKVATVDDRAKVYLQKAHDSTGHLGSLFRDLLSITKMEDGTQKLPKEPVNVNELLVSITSDMQFVASHKGLSLQLTGGNMTDLAPKLFVMANPERLREVIMNLIENAIKYTDRGGVVVQAGGDETQVTVSVADSGPGVAADDLPHLFEKFYRGASTARTTSGTGLGLYLCRSVIESFGGRIWVNSTPGKGSTFSFSLARLTPEQVTKAQRDKEVLIQPTA